MQRQELRVAPHVKGAAGKILAPHRFLQGIVVKGDFQWREALFAKGPRGIAPSLAAFFTSQFVEIGHYAAFPVARTRTLHAFRTSFVYGLRAYVALGQRGGGNEKPSMPKCLEGPETFWELF